MVKNLKKCVDFLTRSFLLKGFFYQIFVTFSNPPVPAAQTTGGANPGTEPSFRKNFLEISSHCAYFETSII